MTDKPNYTKPSSQVSAERVTAADYVPESVLVKGTDPVLSDNGFVNVSTEYQNFANATDKPLVGEEGAEAEIELGYLSDDVDHAKGATAEGDSSDESEDDEESEPAPAPSSSPSNPYSPPPTP